MADPTPGTEGTIRVVRDGDIALLTIDREPRRNALDFTLCEALTAALHEHHDARAVVITGVGRAFCAGADLGNRFADGDAAHGGTDTFRPSFEVTLDTVVAHRAPVIAAINGPAIGAGMQLAVACDLRVVAPTAKLSIPGGKLGILLSPTNIWRLGLLVGHGLARDFLLAGREVDGTTAQQIGLAQHVADDALVAAVGLAHQIAALAPLTVQGHKRALNLVGESLRLTDAARAEITELERVAFASEDLREGTAAFAEKRPPRFRGR